MDGGWSRSQTFLAYSADTKHTHDIINHPITYETLTHPSSHGFDASEKRVAAKQPSFRSGSDAYFATATRAAKKKSKNFVRTWEAGVDQHFDLWATMGSEIYDRDLEEEIDVF